MESGEIGEKWGKWKSKPHKSPPMISPVLPHLDPRFLRILISDFLRKKVSFEEEKMKRKKEDF